MLSRTESRLKPLLQIGAVLPDSRLKPLLQAGLSFSRVFQTHERASHRLEQLPCSVAEELTPIPVINRLSGICRVRLRFPGDLTLSATEQCFVTPFSNVADSRPGHVRRARYYSVRFLPRNP